MRIKPCQDPFKEYQILIKKGIMFHKNGDTKKTDTDERLMILADKEGDVIWIGLENFGKEKIDLNEKILIMGRKEKLQYILEGAKS